MRFSRPLIVVCGLSLSYSSDILTTILTKLYYDYQPPHPDNNLQMLPPKVRNDFPDYICHVYFSLPARI